MSFTADGDDCSTTTSSSQGIFILGRIVSHNKNTFWYSCFKTLRFINGCFLVVPLHSNDTVSCYYLVCGIYWQRATHGLRLVPWAGSTAYYSHIIQVKVMSLETHIKLPESVIPSGVSSSATSAEGGPASTSVCVFNCKVVGLVLYGS